MLWFKHIKDRVLSRSTDKYELLGVFVEAEKFISKSLYEKPSAHTRLTMSPKSRDEPRPLGRLFAIVFANRLLPLQRTLCHEAQKQYIEHFFSNPRFEVEKKMPLGAMCKYAEGDKKEGAQK